VGVDLLGVKLSFTTTPLLGELVVSSSESEHAAVQITRHNVRSTNIVFLIIFGSPLKCIV